jgi:serine/threonine-protein kinase
MTELFRQHLQNALTPTYSLERELGGGGMSRVFVATEVALGRLVVVKVITPDQSEGVSAERFAREMKMAARLQQANIVPVLSTGVAERPSVLHHAVRRGRVVARAPPHRRPRPDPGSTQHPA